MVTLKITRWLIGFVRFTVHGGSPERFYSLSARSGAYLWNMKGGATSGACVAARRYRYLRVSARRAGCTLRVRERHGLPFLIHRTANHRGLWVGTALFFVIIFLLSMRVWCVKITGNTTVPAGQIESALSSAGLRQGTLKKQIDPELLAQEMMLKFPQIRWMSINTSGCVSEVVIQEKTEKPKIAEQKSICNLKASATGQIVSMQIYAGTAMVSRGDAVTEGQLLVSAIVTDQLGGETLKHASAVITAETIRTQTVQVDLKRRRWEPTGKTAVRRNLDLFGASLPISFQRRPAGNFQVTREKADIQLFGTVLPVGIYTERWDEMRAADDMLTKEQALDLAEQQAKKQALEQMNAGKIISSETAEKWEGGKLTYTARFICHENIAKESEIFIK